MTKEYIKIDENTLVCREVIPEQIIPEQTTEVAIDLIALNSEKQILLNNKEIALKNISGYDSRLSEIEELLSLAENMPIEEAN